MKLLKTIFTVAIIALFATSCSNNDAPSAGDNYMEQEYYKCFNYIYKENLNMGVVSTGTTYKFRWRGDFTADVYVYNAKFSASMPDGVNIVIEGLKWSNVNGVKCINATDIVPTKVTMNGNDVGVSSYVIDKLKLEVYERRYIDGQSTDIYIPVINMSMTKGEVEVITVQKQKVYFGSTGVTNTAASTNFTSTDPYYAVTLDPTTMTASIDVYKAKFAKEMPAMDMNFSGVPFEVSHLGYKLFCEELVPTIKGVPYPDYTITNLTGDATFATGLNMQFECMKVFAVQARLGYTDPNE